MIMGSDKSHPKNYRLIPEKKCGAMRSNIIRYVFLKDAQSSKDTILDLALLYQGVISESSKRYITLTMKFYPLVKSS